MDFCLRKSNDPHLNFIPVPSIPCTKPICLCSPNVSKVPIVLGGLLPLVLFATNRPVAQHEEALLEYGKDWYDTFCRCVVQA